MSKRILEHEPNDQLCTDDEGISRKKLKLTDTDTQTILEVLEFDDGVKYATSNQYVFYENAEINIISKTARFWIRKYLKVRRHIDPDYYNIYVHENFLCYGEFELIENSLADIGNGIFSKHKNRLNFSQLLFAFRRIEALTILIANCKYFHQIDDQKRLNHLLHIIACCYITIICSLLPKSMFNDQELNNNDIKRLNKISLQIPNFQQIMQQMLKISQTHLENQYTIIFQTVYNNWCLIINKNFQLHQMNNIDKNSFNFIKEFHIYSRIYPDIGHYSHDISKWTNKRRNFYSLDKFNSISNASLWFRL